MEKYNNFSENGAIIAPGRILNLIELNNAKHDYKIVVMAEISMKSNTSDNKRIQVVDEVTISKEIVYKLKDNWKDKKILIHLSANLFLKQPDSKEAGIEFNVIHIDFDYFSGLKKKEALEILKFGEVLEYICLHENVLLSELEKSINKEYLEEVLSIKVIMGSILNLIASKDSFSIRECFNFSEQLYGLNNTILNSNTISNIQCKERDLLICYLSAISEIDRGLSKIREKINS